MKISMIKNEIGRKDRFIAMKILIVVFLISGLTGCGSLDNIQTRSVGANTEQKKRVTGDPRNISEFLITDSGEGSFIYDGRKYGIYKDYLSWEEGNEKRKVYMKRKEEKGKKYSMDEVYLIHGFLFYSQQKFTEKVIEDGSELKWGEAWLCRFNLETGEIDRSFVMVEKEDADKIDCSLWGVDAELGNLYLNENNKIRIVDFSLNERTSQMVGESGTIRDICWDEGYVFTDEGIFQMKLMPVAGEIPAPVKVCEWPDTIKKSDPYMKVIGVYGDFLYGYAYYLGNKAIAGHYFQVDLQKKSCRVLSADTNKSFFGDYDAEDSFDTDSFVKKHELYSLGRAPDTWDEISIRYILSEDGKVEIKTKKTGD